MKQIKLGYIPLKKYNKSDFGKCDPNQIILEPNQEFILIIDYPLTNPYQCIIKVGNLGLSRIEFVELIIKIYKKIYKEENESSTIKEGAHQQYTYNRNKTNGKYGIYGHQMSDLALHTLYISGHKLSLGIDS